MPERFRPEGATRDYPVLPFETKAHCERTVPLPEGALKLVARFRRESDGSPYLFLSLARLRRMDWRLKKKGRGATVNLNNNMLRHFREIQAKARAHLAAQQKVELKDVDWPLGTMHDLRRTYGTRIARVVGTHVCREFMGHASITTTDEYYLAV